MVSDVTCSKTVALLDFWGRFSPFNDILTLFVLDPGRPWLPCICRMSNRGGWRTFI